MSGHSEAVQAVLGLPVDLPGDLVQPLEIAMVVKGIDNEGKIAYWTVSTPDLLNVEIMCMMRWGEAVALMGGDDA